MKHRMSGLGLLLSAGGLALFLCVPGAAGAGARKGLALCAQALIPSLFPVSVLAGCILRMGGGDLAGRWAGRPFRRLYGLPESGAAILLLGFLGGYPLGARLAAEACRDEALSKEEASRLAGLGNNAGPAFLLGVAGGVFGSAALGALLLGLQLCSGLLSGVLLREDPRERAHVGPLPRAPMPFGAALPQAIGESAGAMLRLTGAVVFFQAVMGALEALLPPTALPHPLRVLLMGSLELSGGVALVSGGDPMGSLPLLAALCGWGGLCVHLQAAEAFHQAGLPLGPYLKHKGLQAGIALLLGQIVLSIRAGNLLPAGLAAGVLALGGKFFSQWKKTHWKMAKPVL